MSNWDAARFNLFWFLSLLIPMVLMVCAGYLRWKWVVRVVAILSIVLTWLFSVSAVVKKWDIRMQEAQTEKEIDEVAMRDGGNQAFMAAVGSPIEAVAYTLFWGWVGWKVGGRRGKMKD